MKIWENIKKYAKVIITVVVAFSTIAIGVFFAIIGFKKFEEKKQIKINDDSLKKIKEDKINDKKTADNIDSDFNSTPFEKRRKKGN
jgi:hypothetical protein